MPGAFSSLTRRARALFASRSLGYVARKGSPFKITRHNEDVLLKKLTERLRVPVSVEKGLRSAFQEFCTQTKPERAVLFSSGPLMPKLDHKPHFHTLASWPARSTDGSLDHGATLTSLTLSIRAVAPVSTLGDIGILVYFPRSLPPRHATSFQRVLDRFIGTVAAMIEVEHRFRVLLRALPYDPLTHLPIWSFFRQKVEARLPRLDRETLPATLMLVSFSGLIATGQIDPDDRNGPDQIADVHDAINFLQRSIRPTDLIGQIDRETYVLWLDGADRFASVERAETICKKHGLNPVGGGDHTVSVRIGLMTREADSTDSVDIFYERARLALSTARENDLAWHFAHESA